MAQEPNRPIATTERVGPALLVILYVIVAAAHAYLAPLTTGPDELAHYEYLNFIAKQGRLPLTLTERQQASYKSDQPPLYHLLAAWPAALVNTDGPPFLKRVTDHNRRQLIERTRHAWGLYNTQDEQWPYHGEVLRWHVGRWVAILFGAAVVAATYFLARDVFGWLGSREPGVGGREQGARSRRAAEQGSSGDKRLLRFSVTRSASFLGSPPHLALVAAAVVAFIPRFALTGSMLNYETLLALCSTLFLWILLRVAVNNEKLAINNEQLTNPTCPPAHLPILQLRSGQAFQLLLLGLFAGLGITAKLSALILPLVLVGGLALIGRRCGWSWQRWIRSVSVAAIGLLLGAGWWFGFVLVQFNTIAQEGWWTGLLRPLIAADASDATTNRLLSALTGGEAGFSAAGDNLTTGPPWTWAGIFFRTFWVAGIEGQQPLGWPGLVVALLLCLLAAVGLKKEFRIQNSEFRIRNLPLSNPPACQPFGLIQDRPSNPSAWLRTGLSSLLITLLLLHFAAAFLLPLIRYAVTFSLADTAQGRHVLFIAGPALAILLVWGLTALTRSGLPICLLPIFLFVWTLTQLYTMTWAYLPPLPVWTTAQNAPVLQYVLDQPLNRTSKLLGYEHRLEAATQLLQVDLVWQATQISLIDYLTEVTLFDAQGQAQAWWQGHPAAGRYPTRAWDPGDLIRDTAWLPTAGLAPGKYTLGLSLEPTAADNPLIGQVADAPDQPLILGQVELPLAAKPTQSALTDTALAASDFTIWQNGRPLAQPRSFRYRETILVTFNGDPPPALFVANSDQSVMAFPVQHWSRAALFMVGPNWPTGSYQLFMTNTKAVSPPLIQVTDWWERNTVEPVISRRVEANFANQIKLLGYELKTNRVEPGGGLPVTLYWQGLDWLGQSYTIFAKLLAADQTVHGGRDRLPQEGYHTLYWAPGEIVTDPFGVPVDPNAPDGVYTLNLGLYREVAGQAVSLPLVEDGQPIEASSVSLGPIKVGRTPAEFVQTQADPHVVLNQPFGDTPHLTLLGFDVKLQTKHSDSNPPTLQSFGFAQDRPSNPSASLRTGLPILRLRSGQAFQSFGFTQDSPSNLPSFQSSILPFTLYWHSESPLPMDYTTFVHLTNSAGELVAQQDQPPLKGAYPTSLWDPGEIIADELALPLPAELPPGRYELLVGLYDPLSGQRLPVPDSAENTVRLLQLELE